MRPSLRFLGARGDRLGRGARWPRSARCPAARCSDRARAKPRAADRRSFRPNSRRSSRSRPRSAGCAERNAAAHDRRMPCGGPVFAVATAARRAGPLPLPRPARHRLQLRAICTPILPDRARIIYSRVPQLDDMADWRGSPRSSMPARSQVSAPMQSAGAASPRRLDRLQLTSWALLRSQQGEIAGSHRWPAAGQLGGSQAGARLTYTFQPPDRAGRSAPAPTSAGAAAKSPAGVRVQPLDQHAGVAHGRAPPGARPLRRRPQRLRLVRRRRPLPAADAVAASASTAISRAAWSAAAAATCSSTAR